MNRIALRLKYGALLYNKKRLFLSVLGIVIGVAALVVMVAVGEGAKRKVLKEFETFSPDTIAVVAGKTRLRGGRPIQISIATTLKLADARALERLWGVKRVAPVYEGSALLEYGDNTVQAAVVGSVPKLFLIRRYTLEEGRVFTEREAWHNAKVVVLGYAVKRDLFGDEDALGKPIRVRKIPFEVIGVMEKMGTDAAGRDLDRQVIIPITSVMNRLFNVDYLTSVLVQVEDESLLDQVSGAIDRMLRKRHLITGEKEPDYSIVKAEEILKNKKRSSMIFSAFVVSVSAISLLVGSFGVMAVMILSVKERRREIGIRKAIGADNWSILKQFLKEAVVITMFGGLVGVLLGALFSVFVAWAFKYPLVLPVKSAFVAFSVTLFFGVASGIYPAKKAAAVDPVTTLRD